MYSQKLRNSAHVLSVLLTANSLQMVRAEKKVLTGRIKAGHYDSSVYRCFSIEL